MLLIIADIGGYTRYMTANAKTLAHGQVIITELIHAIVREIALPLEIAKLEGDAVFLFCRKSPDALQWMSMRAEISRSLLTFFYLFQKRLQELSQSNHCTCQACSHIEKLALKIIVHSGEALFHRVLHFEELAGVDVIIVHRLLKNSVPAGQYLLLTESAMRELQFPETVTFKPGSETYEDIGRLTTAYHDFDLQPFTGGAAETKTFGARYTQAWQTFGKLWFGPFSLRGPSFRNLPGQSGRAGKMGFAILTLLLTPIMLPFGAVVSALQAIRMGRS